jgi:hypothetical protein
MDKIIFKTTRKRASVGRGDTVQVRIPTPMYAKIKEISLNTGLSTKDVSKRLLEFALEHTEMEE